MQILAISCIFQYISYVGIEMKKQKGENMKEKALIAKINKLYPRVKATPMAEYYDDPTEVGIWFRGSEDGQAINGMPLYDCYEEWGYEVAPEMEKILTKAGWMAEPYDAGTLMAYPG